MRTVINIPEESTNMSDDELQYALFDGSAIRMLLSHKFEIFVDGIGWTDPRELKVGYKLSNFGTVVFVGNEADLRAYMETHEPWM